MSTDLKSRTRADYHFFLPYRTRWNDNDQYSHINNAIYYHLFDSIVNTYLITHCSLHPPSSPQIGLVIHSNCTYFSPVSFPAVLELGLRVNKLGKSSVEYEIGVFEEEGEMVKAVGGFVHVFVGREDRRPRGIGGDMREGLERLLVVEGGKKEEKAKL